MKSGIIFFLSALFSFNTYAQNILEGYWGVKAGFNMNKISKIELSNSFKPGFHFGAFANFQLNDNFSISHEVLIGVRGVSIDLPNKEKYTQTFTFLDLPWMLNYHFSPNFYISGGVQPSIYAYFRKPQADTVEYNKDNVNSIEFSYLLGAAFLFDNNFGFGVRFNGGIFPLFDLESDNNKNYNLQLFLSYAINKKKGRRKK